MRKGAGLVRQVIQISEKCDLYYLFHSMDQTCSYRGSGHTVSVTRVITKLSQFILAATTKR